MAPPLGSKCRIKNEIAREFLAEFLGTFILIVMGDGAVAQMVLANDPKMSTFLSVNFGYAMAVALGVYVCGGVSGGHINPAVTLVMAVIGRLKWKKVPVYMIGQYLGAFLGAAVVFGVYHDLIVSHAKGELTVTGEVATAGIFATYPNGKVSTGTALGDQILGTALLLIFVMALTDGNNSGPHKGFVPLLVGLSVLAIGLSFGINAGYAINPARDLGPRLFTLAAGYGTETFTAFSTDSGPSKRSSSLNGTTGDGDGNGDGDGDTAASFYFWVPIVGPHLGAFIGVFVYLIFIENHWPEDLSSYDIPAPEKYNDLPV